jgi:hypothetical protein
MADEAGRTAVVYDARADEFDEPLRVFVTGYSATELRDRRRPRGNLRYSLVGGLPRAARWQIGAPGVLLAVGVDRSTQGAEQAFRGQGSLRGSGLVPCSAVAGAYYGIG